MIGCFVMKKPCIIYLFLKRNSQYKSNKEKKNPILAPVGGKGLIYGER